MARLFCLTLTFIGSLFAVPSLTSTANAGLGPENCLLIINSDSESSKRIGNAYIELRGIPASNVIRLSNIPATERINADEFQHKILKPILNQLIERRLQNQIDCVIYSTDFPTSVGFKKWTDDLGRQTTKIETPIGSLTSLTYFYKHCLAGSPGLIGLDANAYARRPAQIVLNLPFVSPDAMKRFSAARDLYKDKKWEEAEREFDELLKEQPYQAGLAYWKCRTLAQAGDQAAATKAMMDAVKRGWEFRKFSEEDPELQSLQSYAPFNSALKAIEEPFWTMSSPVSFHATLAWGPNGMPENLKQSGNSYLLSCMLGVSSGSAAKVNTDQEILTYLRRSAKADHTQPKGDFVFADHKDVRSKTRKPNFAAAVAALKGLGFSSEVVNGTLPKKNTRVLGATIGSAKFDWNLAGDFQPGGIGDNLTSFGARFDSKNGQTTIAEFLRHGAAGASGTVVEPYALQHKFPHPLIHAYYARGFSLIESFYMSLTGPFQTLIVGDPLCQPFAKCVKLKVAGVNPNAEVSEKVAFKVQLDQSDAKIAAVQFFFDGRKIGSLKSGNFSMDTTRHSDGYHELRFVSVSNDRTQAQSNFVLPLVFNNHKQQVTFTAESKSAGIQVKANAAGAKSIQIVCQGETLTTIDSSSGQLTLDSKVLGDGPVQLQAIAKFGDQSVSSLPVHIDIN